MGVDTAIYLLFLGLVVVVFRLLPARARVAWLLAASAFFYATWSCSGLVLLALICGVNYLAVRSLGREGDGPRRTFVFGAAVSLNLIVLLLFKYASKWIGQITGDLGVLSSKTNLFARIAIPLGISYFTFQMMSCITDAYRRTWRLQDSACRFFLFGFFFPQISSGPIPRAGRLLPQLVLSRPTTDDILAGLRLIAFGLFKKYVVANRLGDFVGQVFEKELPIRTLSAAIGCCFNALQLYADFSGYVDIAIGSARLLGVRLDPNFDAPFKSASVTEFWRRWHMTLSFWLRDYVYMPLLVRIRVLGRAGIAAALIVTFALCGVWHAATWPYLLFGVAQGVAMTMEMLTKSWRKNAFRNFSTATVAFAGSVYTLTFFVLTEVLFRSRDLAQAKMVYGKLFTLKPPLSAMELFMHQGPFFMALAFVSIAAWLALAWLLPKATERSTPWFVFVCALLILFFGRLSARRFIYAGF